MKNITNKEIALQLTLKLLDNFKYSIEEYGGNSMTEHAKINAETATLIFNEIFNNLDG